MSIEELKQKFDAACTELANDAQTVVETHFFITAYMKMFNEIPSGWSNLTGYIHTIEKDRGFYFFTAVIKNLIGDNVNLYFIILALIQVALLIKVYRKY